MDKLSKRVRDIIKCTSKIDIIIVGHYAYDVIPADEISLVFVLRRHPEEIKKVLEERGYEEKKVWENVAAEILDVCLNEAVETCGLNKICQINVTKKSLSEVVGRILQILQQNGNRYFEKIDWLTTLEKDGRLEEYLKRF